MGLCVAYGEQSIRQMNIRRSGYEKALCAGMALAMGGAASALPKGWKITDLIDYLVSPKNVGS